jgi:hypothetical protein
MGTEANALLEAFEHLPAEEQRAFTEELLRRCPSIPSGWRHGLGIGDDPLVEQVRQRRLAIQHRRGVLEESVPLIRTDRER